MFDKKLFLATKITSDFNLIDYFASKVAAYGLDLFSLNTSLKNFVESIASLEQIKIVGFTANAVRHVATEGLSVEALTKIAVDGMAAAGINKNTMDFVTQISNRYKDILALLSRDFDQVLKRVTSAGINHFLDMFDENSLFKGLENRDILTCSTSYTGCIRINKRQWSSCSRTCSS